MAPTLMGAAYYNAGQTFIQTGNLEFAGPTTNAGLIEAEENTAIEFSHTFKSTVDSSILSLNEVSFSSPLYTALVKGDYSVQNATHISGKETVFHSDTNMEKIGEKV